MRAKALVNPIESLTSEEKERLGFLIMWYADGPEQGMLTGEQWRDLREELLQFLDKNGVKARGFRSSLSG